MLSGLVAEDNDQRVVLKTQGGKLETIARPEVESMTTSRLSLMPEDLEKQLRPQELADLFALLTLDKPPGDPTARRLRGSQPIVARETSDPVEFRGLVEEVAPGFATSKVGKPGLAIVAEHAGRPGVLKSNSVNVNEPCVLRGTVEVPKDKRTRLVLTVSQDPKSAWTLKVNADGQTLHQSAIGADSSEAAWQTISVDLSQRAGKKVKLEVMHAAHDGKLGPAYWGQVEIVSE